MNKIAIAIGVAKAGGLTAVPGAVNGAKNFAKWFGKNGYDVRLITDEPGAVTAQQIKDVLFPIVKDGDTDRLIIYFAGHGTQPREGAQFWLLSNWEEDANETVDVTLSTSAAKRSSIQQISIIADACRSQVKGASSLSGSVIFPRMLPVAGPLPQWDHFFGARIEEDAQEVSNSDATQAYGIFSRCLMQALEFADTGAAQLVGPPIGQKLVVTSGTLANYLDKVLPYESGKLRGGKVQWPDTNSGWRSPNDVYAEKVPDPNLAGAPHSDRRTRTFDLNHIEFWRTMAAGNEILLEKFSKPLNDGLLSRETALAQGRRAVVQNDIGIVGSDVSQMVSASVPVGDGALGKSVAVELTSGHWLGLFLPRGFQLTVVVADSGAAGVTARGGGMPILTSRLAPLQDRWMALMAKGRFPERADLAQAIGQLKTLDTLDPSLTILAAYAFEHSGLLDDVDKLVDLYARKAQAVPFDIALLSRRGVMTGEDRVLWAQGSSQERVRVAGTFPCASLGWNYLVPNQAGINPELLNLRSGLVRGLWTTFGPGAGKRFAELISKGEL